MTSLRAVSEPIVPRRLRARHGKRARMKNAAGDGARHDHGRRVTEFGQFPDRLDQLAFARGGGENRIPVDRRVGRQHGARQPAMRHDGKPMCLRFRQQGIRHDQPDRRAGDGGGTFHDRGEIGGEKGGGPSEAAKFRILLEGCRPEPLAMADGRRAERVARQRSPRAGDPCGSACWLSPVRP